IRANGVAYFGWTPLAIAGSACNNGGRTRAARSPPVGPFWRRSPWVLVKNSHASQLHVLDPIGVPCRYNSPPRRLATGQGGADAEGVRCPHPLPDRRFPK